MWWPSKHLLLELGCVPPSIHMKEAYQDMKCWGHTLGWDKALGLPITEAIDYLTGIHIQVDSLSFEPRLETHSIEWHQHLEWWFCITASPRNDLSLRLWCVSCRSQAYCIDRVLNWGSRREYLFFVRINVLSTELGCLNLSQKICLPLFANHLKVWL